jgi:uncharacterized protein (UPF0210 family)
VVDLSLAPTPAVGDSVADILERLGWKASNARDDCALALLTTPSKRAA